MKAEHINPFVSAVSLAFDTMLGCRVWRSGLSLKTNTPVTYDYTGVIGLTGKAVGMVVALSLSKPVATRATAAMLMTDASAVQDHEIADAVGELTNMVAGAAKAKLEQFRLTVSLPGVICGKSQGIAFPDNMTPTSVTFDSDWGPLSMEVGLLAEEDVAVVMPSLPAQAERFLPLPAAASLAGAAPGRRPEGEGS